MTWGECRLAALQTMFANEGKTLTADDSNQEYLDAMPAKANEALQQLCTVGRPLLRPIPWRSRRGRRRPRRRGS